MKKRICALVLVFLMILSMSVAAATRVTIPSLSLTFDGTSATCDTYIRGESSSDKVSATVKLWHGSSCLKTWTQSATNYLHFSETYDGVEVGQKYKMTVDYTIAGKSYDQLYASATCRG